MLVAEFLSLPCFVMVCYYSVMESNLSTLSTIRIEQVIFNSSSSIPHVHCYATSEAGEDEIRQLTTKKRNAWQIVGVNCLFADGCLKTLLRSIAVEFGYKKKVDTIDDVCTVIRDSMSRTGSKRSLIFLFDAYALSRLSNSSFNALLSMPRLANGVRLVTVSDCVWHLTEHTVCAGSTYPVQISVDIPLSEEDLINAIWKEMPTYDSQLIRLVVLSVHSHTTDKQLIKRIIETTSSSLDKMDLDSRERQARAMESIMALLKRYERETLMLPSDDSAKQESISLPVNLKLLLLASFFASYNPATSDKRYFSKLHGKEKRNEARERASDLANEQNEPSPKAVDVQRICFIRAVLSKRFESDMQATEPEKENRMVIPPCEMDNNTQLNSLVCMALLERSSCAANLDQPKFKCLISKTTAATIARSLDIEVDTYLDHNMS